jgi:hypothetical protein
MDNFRIAIEVERQLQECASSRFVERRAEFLPGKQEQLSSQNVP